MARVKQPRQQRRSRFLFSTVTTLALWQTRRTWFLLVLLTLGMTCAVVIVSTIPLLFNIMTTAGIRSTLRATPYSADITISTQLQGISSSLVKDVRGKFDTLLHQSLGDMVKPSQSSLASNDFSLPSSQKNSYVTLYASSIREAIPHLTLVQGQFASSSSTSTDEIEVMMTPDTAQRLGLRVGSTFPLTAQYTVILPTTDLTKGPPKPQKVSLTARVAGLFSVPQTDTVYWQGNDFKTIRLATEGSSPVDQYTFLVSDTTLLTFFDHLRSLNATDAIHSATYSGYSLTWHYTLDTSRVTASNLSKLIDGLSNLQSMFYSLYGDVQNNVSPDTFLPYPYFLHVSLAGPLVSTNSLGSFQSRIAVAQVPSGVFTLLVLALVLFFVSLLTTLLVERQAGTIAILRSRGASSGQVFGALLFQSILLGVIALGIGIPIAIGIVLLLAQRTLPIQVRDALSTVTGNILQSGLEVVWYAVITVLVAIFAMSISLFMAARMNILSLRREVTRSSRRPVWQRLNLDIFAGVLALAGYGLSLYVTSIGAVLQGDAKVLLGTPLSLIAPLFLVVGCLLLFLRLFPLLLRLVARLATRARGAVSLLAVAQIARTPYQPVRMIMLLALALAFALFTLLYRATEAEHIQQVVTYQTGADFSAQLHSPKSSLSQLSSQYRAVPGVLSASVGYIDRGAGGTAAFPMEVRAVDAASFGSSVLWSSPETFRAARPLLTQLATPLPGTSSNLPAIPAIVDQTTLNTLQLHVNSLFLVKLYNASPREMNCFVIGTVDHIPTVNDRVAPQNGASATGGVLVDYQAYLTAYKQEAKQPGQSGQVSMPLPNRVWLHTRDDANSLTSVRVALQSSQFNVSDVVDRRLLLTTLQSDPLYLILDGILGIGTITALLLAIVGDLLASWLSASTRLTSFATLRALGATSRQIIGILLWEQGIIYILGFLLGGCLGAFLAKSLIPALTFTDLNIDLSNQQLFDLQSALSTQIMIPPNLPLVLLVVLAIFAVALLIMVCVVSHPSPGQRLRLNED